jgi:ABC-type transport system substrate-binding protein
MVFLNLDSPGATFMSDPQIRRALMLGLNRRWIADRIMGGQAIIAHSPIFPESWAYYDGMTHMEYDPQAAIELLKKAGYTIRPRGTGSLKEGWHLLRPGISNEFLRQYC